MSVKWSGGEAFLFQSCWVEVPSFADDQPAQGIQEDVSMGLSVLSVTVLNTLQIAALGGRKTLAHNSRFKPIIAEIQGRNLEAPCSWLGAQRNKYMHACLSGRFLLHSPGPDPELDYLYCAGSSHLS